MNILLNVLYINNVHIQANCFDFHLILGGVFALKKFEMFEQCNTLICFDQKRYKLIIRNNLVTINNLLYYIIYYIVLQYLL